MKKFISMAMAGCMALSLAACGGSSASTAESTATSTEATSEAAASGSKTDVAFVTDVGNIDDQSFNQYTWQGVQDFCSANSLNANYYRPTEDSDAARLEQMDNAVNDGAKAVVVAGYLFGSSIAEAQAKYPDVEFTPARRPSWALPRTALACPWRPASSTSSPRSSTTLCMLPSLTAL